MINVTMHLSILKLKKVTLSPPLIIIFCEGGSFFLNNVQSLKSEIFGTFFIPNFRFFKTLSYLKFCFSNKLKHKFHYLTLSPVLFADGTRLFLMHKLRSGTSIFLVQSRSQNICEKEFLVIFK